MGLFGRKRSAKPAQDGASPPIEDDDPPASGWDAIDAALRPLYGDAVPHHVGYGAHTMLSDNLQGCSAYAREDHWHYVPYGLSNLFDQDEPDNVDEHGRQVSGWGCELTFRLARGPEQDPPKWAFVALNEICRYVRRTAAPLDPGHRLDLQRPITGFPDVEGAPDTGLTVDLLTLDPELGRIDTPNGRMEFLQVVGITAAEKAVAVEAGDQSAGLLARRAAEHPLLVTDPARSAPAG